MNFKEKIELINTPGDIFKTGKELLKDGHELVDTLSEYSPYLKVGSKWMNYRKEKKCKEFLQGLGVKLLLQEELTSDDLKKLDELLMKNANKLLVLDILEVATNTVSDKSSKLLGIIAGQAMEEEREFKYNDWILVNGLKNMNNWDLENFKKVYAHFELYPREGSVNAACLFLETSMKEYMDTTDPSILSIVHDEECKMLKSSLMRISSLQILSPGPMLMDNDGVSFERSEVGYELYKLMNALEL